ncbi:MAG: ABC transporter ATP-binding protein [Parvibaculum sp.]
MDNDAPHIRISNVSKHFVRRDGTAVRAIDGISLDIQQGEFLVLLGPSGCGKTTLLRSIAGLESPDSGAIIIDGQPVYDFASGVNVTPEKRKIGMMFQSYALWPHMTIEENVKFPMQMRGVGKDETREKIDHVLAMMHVADLAQQYPGQLSGGQQQRVALARAIVCSHHLVLFDEPLSNVDAKVREHLRIELSLMQRKLGFTAIYVTHDQEEAMALADRVVVLGEGKVWQAGHPEEVYRRPVDVRVADFIGSANFFRGTLTGNGAERRVETSLGTLTVPENRVRTSDRDVVVMSRPERWRVAAQAPGSGEGWVGKIAAVAFMGPHSEFLIEIGDQVVRIRDQAASVLKVGAEVWCSIDMADLQVLSAQGFEGIE